MVQMVVCSNRPFAAATAKSSPCTAVVTDVPRSLRSVGRKAALILPAIIPPAAAAWAEDLTDAAQQGAEAGRQALSASQVPQWSQVQIPGGLKAPTDIANILGDSNVNPILLLGAVAAVAVPALLFQALNPGSTVKGSSPGNVVATLTEESRAQLLDIRSAADVKAEGSPDLKGTKRRALSLPYTRVAKDGTSVAVEGWAGKAAKLGALKSNSIVILLDSDGKSAKKAAAELDSSAVEEIYFVTGGAESWQKSGQPWKEPGRGFTLDLSSLSQTVSQGIGTMRIKAGENNDEQGSGGFPNSKILVGVGAVLGAFLLVNQTGAFLEIVGLGAAANFALKNFVFAKDRERSTQQFRELVAPEEMGKDVNRLTSALLESGDNWASVAEAKVEGAIGSAKDTASKVGDDVKSAASDAKADLKSGSNGAADNVESAAEDVQDKAEGANKDAKAWIGSWKDKSTNA